MTAISYSKLGMYMCLLEKLDDNYSGFVPDVPTVVASGRTRNDVIEALAEGLHTYSKHAKLPPAASSLADLEEEFRKENVEFAEVAPAKDDPVSQALDNLFQKEKVTHREVAERLGISRAAVSRLANPYYHGHSLDSLRKVARALGYELEVSFKKTHNN